MTNLDEDPHSSDFELRVVLVPELCERLSPSLPGASDEAAIERAPVAAVEDPPRSEAVHRVPTKRGRLRRISSTLAEYTYDPDQPPIFHRVLPTNYFVQEAARADDLRARIGVASRLEVPDLVERTRFAVAGARLAEGFPPDFPVYEQSFTYRIVPVLALRVLQRRDARGESR